jgi:hypothetical protein
MRKLHHTMNISRRIPVPESGHNMICVPGKILISKPLEPPRGV